MKKILVSFFVLLLFFTLVGCGKTIDSDNTGGNDGGSNGNPVDYDVVNQPNRIIVYTVSAKLYVSDIRKEVLEIKKSLNDDEWTEYEDQTENYTTIKIRVKTTRLDSFLIDLENKYKMSNLSKNSEDLSLNYYDYQNIIAALELQRDKINERLDTASDALLVSLLNQLREVENELQKLYRKVNEINTDVLYSLVTISIFKDQDISEDKKENFFDTVWNSWKGIFNGLFSIFTFFVRILPIIAIIVPIVIILTKLNKKKKTEFTERLNKGQVSQKFGQNSMNKPKVSNTPNDDK